MALCSVQCRAQKSLPWDVSKSIEALFSGDGKKEGFFESFEAMTVFAGASFKREAVDSSKSVEPIPVFEGTDSEKIITFPSSSSQSCKSCSQSDLPSWQSDRAWGVWG